MHHQVVADLEGEVAKYRSDLDAFLEELKERKKDLAEKTAAMSALEQQSREARGKSLALVQPCKPGTLQFI